jgi:putative ABC transport system substrate-binding protein
VRRVTRRAVVGSLGRFGVSVAGLGLVAGCGLPLPMTTGPKVRRIGYMSGASVEAEEEAIRIEFSRHGWIEGDNLVIERRFYRSAENAARQAAELVSQQVEVLMTAGSTATAAARAATSSIPIVMIGVVDPVGVGFVSNLARPDANLTGNAYEAGPLASKQLEILRDIAPGIAPGISRIAFLWNPQSPGNAANARSHHALAPSLGLDLHDVQVRTAEEIPRALEAIHRIGPDALRLLPEEVFNRHKSAWLGFAAEERLPAMYQQLDWVAAGGLMAYLADIVDLYRRGVAYVDRILRGAKPSSMPIEQPTVFEFQVNRTTAEALGITVPRDIALQVTKWLE